MSYAWGSGSEVKIRIGQLLRDRRLALGMSQTELARRVGVPDAAISHVECGRREPRIGLFASICAELGVTMDEVYGEAAA